MTSESESTKPWLEENRRRAATGMVWTTGAQLVGHGFAIASKLLLARLLVPADFGLVAMAAVVISFLELLSGLGIPAALVQTRELDETTKSSALWAALAQGVGLAALGIIASPLIADGFGAVELVPILKALLVGGAITAPLGVLESLFLRGLEFRLVAMRKVLGNVLGGALAIALALAGFGVWALVAGRLMTSAAALILVLMATTWRPRLVFSLSALRPLTGFGFGMTGVGLILAVGRQLPAVLIGRLLGSEALGLFNLAQQVILLPLQSIARPMAFVLFPVFSRLREQPEERLATFVRWQFVIVALGITAPALAVALGPLAVDTILGARWEDAGSVVQVMAIPAVARLGVSSLGAGLGAAGLVRVNLLWTAAILLLEGAGLLVGIRAGLFAAALGWSIGSLLTAGVVGTFLAARYLDVPVQAQLRPFALVALPAVVLAVTAWVVAQALIGAPALVQLLVACPAGVIAYAVSLRLVAPIETGWMVRGAWSRLRGLR
ncbi:MAG: oligosaccharide flippase family protein [Planctomycetes bacterium]|nr:oligosaccharide flippase family protein [Planctomycetota bacterium]